VSLRLVTGIGVGTWLERNHHENKWVIDRGRTWSPPTLCRELYDIRTAEYEKRVIESKTAIEREREKQSKIQTHLDREKNKASSSTRLQRE
ncbi:hypothetical protein J6590_072878, partial [Homalodisca vitripennis]